MKTIVVIIVSCLGLMGLTLMTQWMRPLPEKRLIKNLAYSIATNVQAYSRKYNKIPYDVMELTKVGVDYNYLKNEKTKHRLISRD